MERTRFIGGLFAGFVLTLGVGCSRQPTDAARAPAVDAEPRVLRIAYVPQVDMEERYAAAYRTLESYLGSKLGMKVEVSQVESVNVALEGLRGLKLDLCNFSPWPYLIAEQKVGMQALLVTGAADGSPVSYRTVLVARPSLGLRSVEDMRARPGEIVFSFEEPVSTSGHLVPRSFFHEIGFDADRSFKQTLFSPDSTVSLLAVRAGRIDVVAVSQNSFERALEKRRISRDDVTVIWTSPPVLANVVAIRRALPEAFKARVREAFVQMHSASPEQWSVVARQYSQPVARYLPADDSLLERYRTAIRNVPGLQISL